MEEEERSPQEVLSLVVSRAMEAKYELCADNNGMTDAPALMLGELPNGDGFLMPDTLDGHPAEHLPLMLGALGEGLANRMETEGSVRWKWLAFVVEGYAKPATDNLPDEWERGQYEEEYKTNPATDIREGIIVSVFCWDGTRMGATVFYRYDDNGLPVYEEPQLSDSNGLGGNISDIFVAFTEACHAYETERIAKTN